MRKERQSNFELLRIIAMVMVISLHFLGHGGVSRNVKVFSFNFYMANLLESFSIYAVNVYVLISAYFMCESKITIEKIVKVWTQVIFYTVSIYLILVMFGKVTLGSTDLIKALLPVVFNQYSFVTAYIILMLFSPFLNKLIHAMNKTEFKKLMVNLFLVFIFFGLLFPIKKIVSNYVTLFIFLYFLSAYIKKYCKKISVKQSLLLYVGSSSLIFIGIILLYLTGLERYRSEFFNYRFILVVLGSIGLFTLFINIEIKSKMINRVSSLTFGVFLIHENYLMRNIIYYDIFKIPKLQ